jgi:peptidyl-prolyl cis-trans isomerase SurA
VIRVRSRAAVAAVAALAMTGCSVPGWVPLLGKQKPPAAKPQAVAAPDPAAAPTPSSPADLLLTGAARLPESDDVMDRVICVVNNDAITMYELVEAEAQYLQENREQAPEGEARKVLRTRLLDHIIENRIQLQQAEREKITVDEAEITEQTAEIMKKVNAKTPQEFEAILKSQGLTVDGAKKRIREQLMVQRLARRKVTQRVSVTEQEIDKYLADNREKLETGLSFEAGHILFLPTAGAGEEGWADARRKAEQVYALLLEGQAFADLAKKYSEDGSGKDGGNLGTLKRGELAPDIEAAILKLEPGEVSAPFRSQVGYHLFHLVSKQTLTGQGLVQARNQIRDILFRQKYEARMQEWLTEIKQRAIIDIRL